MRYHLFQKFFGKMVEIKETSFISSRGAVCFALNCRWYCNHFSKKRPKSNLDNTLSLTSASEKILGRTISKL